MLVGMPDFVFLEIVGHASGRSQKVVATKGEVACRFLSCLADAVNIRSGGHLAVDENRNGIQLRLSGSYGRCPQLLKIWRAVIT